MPPIVLLNFYFYTDSICDESAQILETENPSRNQDQQQKQLGISNRPAHESDYPFIQEFSDLIQDLSSKELESLLTNQQRNLAKAFWEAENYGGCREKCKKRLAEIYGRNWMKEVKFRDHFRSIDEYYRYVLLVEHQRQWDNYRNLAMLNQANDPE